MNTGLKFILAALAVAAVFFLGGWGLSGALLMDYYKAHTSQKATELMQGSEMKLWAIGLANICYGILIAWVILKAGFTSVVRGMMAGALTAALLAVSFNLFLIGFLNMYDMSVPFVAAIENAVLGGIAGAIAGPILSPPPKIVHATPGL